MDSQHPLTPSPPITPPGSVAPASPGHGRSEVVDHHRMNGARPVTYLEQARGAGDDAEQLLSPAFVLRAIWQWRAVALPLALALAVGSSYLIWHFFEPVYRASAWIQIESETPYLAYRIGDDLEEAERLQFVQTQIELIKSPLVLASLVSRPEIAQLPLLRDAEDPLETLTEQIGVESVGQSELFEVVCSNSHPEHAALLVNAAVDAYLDLREQKQAQRDQRVVELLEQEKEQRASQVQELREKMRELGKEVYAQGVLPNQLADVAVASSPLNGAYERLGTAEVERQVLEAQVKAAEEAIAEDAVPVPAAIVEMGIGDSDEIKQLNGLITARRVALQQIQTTSAQGKNDPAYERVAREIEGYEQTLQELRDTTRPGVQQQMQMLAVLEQQDELADLKRELESRRSIEDMLRQRYQQQLQQSSDSGGQLLELEFARLELAREEKVFELIAERVMALRTEMRAPGRVTLMRRAETPTTPVQTFPLQQVALACLASLCLPLAGAVLWEYKVRRITRADQLQQLSNLAVLAEVSKLPSRSSVGAHRSAGPGPRALELFEESIDSLRTCLVLPDQHAGVHVLAVASAVSGEGKTSVATQLAISMARSTGQPTLLIDADLRSPDIHRAFKIDAEPGLSQVLDGQCTAEEAINTSWSESLHLLPGGKLHKSPHKLFGGDAFKNLLNELRPLYAHIVIDTPPILPACESLVIARQADGTIVSVMRQFSREEQTKLAYQKLHLAGAKPIGAVLNGVPVSQYKSTYGNYTFQLERV